MSVYKNHIPYGKPVRERKNQPWKQTDQGKKQHAILNSLPSKTNVMDEQTNVTPEVSTVETPVEATGTVTETVEAAVTQAARRLSKGSIEPGIRKTKSPTAALAMRIEPTPSTSEVKVGWQPFAVPVWIFWIDVPSVPVRNAPLNEAVLEAEKASAKV